MRNYDELILSANIAMLEKLKENVHKPDWSTHSLDELFDYLCSECDELENEIYNQMYVSGRALRIRREAADIANFAAMIIQLCDKMIAGLEGKA